MRLYLFFRRGLFFWAAGLIVSAFMSCALVRSATLPTKFLLLGDQKLKVEIAQTEQQRNLGLMHRKILEKNAGMWFVFEQANPYCFWMKNTLIPLSIAFVNEHYVIVDLFDMAPRSEMPVCASQPVLYALEVNQGWFAQHQLTQGMRIKFLDRAARKTAP